MTPEIRDGGLIDLELHQLLNLVGWWYYWFRFCCIDGGRLVTLES